MRVPCGVKNVRLGFLNPLGLHIGHIYVYIYQSTFFGDKY